jgi:hypothetical protein
VRRSGAGVDRSSEGEIVAVELRCCACCVEANPSSVVIETCVRATWEL